MGHQEEIIYSGIADACIFYEKKTRHSLINIGTGKDQNQSM